MTTTHKPIIAVDFDGALMRSRPFEEAHKQWFIVMSQLLNDPSVAQYAGMQNYFPKVEEVMKRYLGDVDKQTTISFSRFLYSMLTIAQTRADDAVSDFAQYLRNIRPRFRLALITTAPEDSVEPILKKTGCSDIFDILYKSPIGKHPNKKELFEEFIARYGKPVYYIGKGDEDIISARELGISPISVDWVSQGKVKGDYDIHSVAELEKIIK